MSYTCYPCGNAVSDEEHNTVQALFDAIDLLDLHWEFGKDSDGRTESLTNHLGLYHIVGKPENFDSTSSVVVCQACLDGALKATSVLEELDFPNTPRVLIDHKASLALGSDFSKCPWPPKLLRPDIL